MESSRWRGADGVRQVRPRKGSRVGEEPGVVNTLPRHGHPPRALSSAPVTHLAMRAAPVAKVLVRRRPFFAGLVTMSVFLRRLLKTGTPFASGMSSSPWGFTFSAPLAIALEAGRCVRWDVGVLKKTNLQARRRWKACERVKPVL